MRWRLESYRGHGVHDLTGPLGVTVTLVGDMGSAQDVLAALNRDGTPAEENALNALIADYQLQFVGLFSERQAQELNAARNALLDERLPERVAAQRKWRKDASDPSGILGPDGAVVVCAANRFDSLRSVALAMLRDRVLEALIKADA